jgi:hypothetical protein
MLQHPAITEAQTYGAGGKAGYEYRTYPNQASLYKRFTEIGRDLHPFVHNSILSMGDDLDAEQIETLKASLGEAVAECLSRMGICDYASLPEDNDKAIDLASYDYDERSDDDD